MSNYLCVAVTQKRLNVGIVSDKAEILNYQYTYYDEIPEEKVLVQSIVKMAKSVMVGYDPMMATVSVPEIVDAVQGTWSTHKFGMNIPLRDDLQKKFGIPTYIDNDVNVAAVGEKYFGSMKYTENFFYLSVAYGIGGAIYLNNNLFRGVHNGAGELGHIVIDDNGGPCTCGNNGCLQTLASSGAISEYYGVLTENANPPIYKDIAVLARQGDVCANDAFKRAGFALGRAISFILNATNITRFVIGGTVGMELDLLYPSMIDAINKFAYKITNYDFKITKTELGYDASLIGCAAYCACVQANPNQYALLSKKNL